MTERCDSFCSVLMRKAAREPVFAKSQQGFGSRRTCAYHCHQCLIRNNKGSTIERLFVGQSRSIASVIIPSNPLVYSISTRLLFLSRGIRGSTTYIHGLERLRRCLQYIQRYLGRQVSSSKSTFARGASRLYETAGSRSRYDIVSASGCSSQAPSLAVPSSFVYVSPEKNRNIISSRLTSKFSLRAKRSIGKMPLGLLV